MKRLLFILLFASMAIIANSQTNVSGGIYSNTTWTKVNSPYIVTDSGVVVFPGVTLTIEPGVVVKFDNGNSLEIRQGKIIAEGTVTDSITFTSSTSPIPNYWRVFLDHDSSSSFNYCNFIYSAYVGLYRSNNNGNSITLANSKFISDYQGISITCGGLINSCIFKYDTLGAVLNTNINMNNCNISNNHNGVTIIRGWLQNSIIDSNITGVTAGEADSIFNNVMTINNIGLNINNASMSNSITRNIIENNNYGIIISNASFGVENNVICNKICNNTIYDLDYITVGNANFSDNYWCTTDSATVASHIYDGYNNINYGLVSFMPIDTIGCYLTSGIFEPMIAATNNILIYPNPAVNMLTIESPQEEGGSGSRQEAVIEINNVQGQLIQTYAVTGSKTDIDVTSLQSGMYFVVVKSEKGVEVKKFVKE